MEKITLTRKELYDLVWSHPLSSLSKKYNISYHVLIKVCEKLNVPIPETGHWQKVQFGKPISIKPLPLAYEGKNEFTFNEISLGINNEGIQSPVAIIKTEIENNFSDLLIVHRNLSSPDKLITERLEAMKKWKAIRNTKEGIYASFPRNIISIDVSEENYNRALCFMDAFIKLLRARGHDIICSGGTFLIVDNQKMQISLVERMKREMVQHEKYDWKSAKYSKSGILLIRFREGAYRTIDWAEGKQPIEKLLSKIVANIEIKAQELKEYQIKLEKGWAEQREKALIRENRENLIKKELADFKNLIAEADRWFEIKKIRSYLDDVEAKLRVNEHNSEEIKNWLKWARKKVEWYEPNSKIEDELLRGIDKNTLTINKNSY
jgi:hypothetical protein